MRTRRVYPGPIPGSLVSARQSARERRRACHSRPELCVHSAVDGEELPQITPAHLRRADEMCRRRLAREVNGGQALRRTRPATCASRSRIASKPTPGSRRPRPGHPRPEAFVEPRELEPEQQALYRAATRGYLDAFGDTSKRAIVELGFRTALPELGVELSSNLGLAAELADGGRELRKMLVGVAPRREAARRRRHPDRAGAHRGVGAGAARDRRRRRDRATAHATYEPDLDTRTRRGARVDRRTRRHAFSSSPPTPGRRPAATARVARSSPAARSIRAATRRRMP